MSDASIGSITQLFQQLRAGDGAAAGRLWERFFPRLIGLARRVLAGRELPLGADDAVQTAFFHFFQRVERGEFDGHLNRDDLWRLLSLMVAQAARKQAIREAAGKRGAGRVVTESVLDGGGNHRFRLDDLLGAVNAPDCDLICEELLNQLDDDLREIAVLRLAGYTNPQIKDILKCPLRSIERRMQLIRAIWTAKAADAQ
jgi:DNA-directed RNA polymerase specialized sigma24 family protein